MKKFNYIFTLLIISVSAVIFTGCPRKDKIAPQIFLKGSNPMYVTLGAMFTDPGYTADDNFDGSDIVQKVTVTHNIPTDGLANGTGLTKLVGTYTVTYTVSDKKGNSCTKTRTVYVVNSMLRFAIDYIVKKTNDGHLDTATFHEYNNLFDTLQVDSRTNMRIIFPKVSRGITNLSNRNSFPGFLRIYGDVHPYTDASQNKKLLIYIPEQTFRKFDIGGYPPPYQEWRYKIIGVGGTSLSSESNIDTAYQNIIGRYCITLRYTILKYKKLNVGDPGYAQAFVDSTDGTHWGGTPTNPQYYKSATCTETYIKQ